MLTPDTTLSYHPTISAALQSCPAVTFSGIWLGAGCLVALPSREDLGRASAAIHRSGPRSEESQNNHLAQIVVSIRWKESSALAEALLCRSLYAVRKAGKIRTGIRGTQQAEVGFLRSGAGTSIDDGGSTSDCSRDMRCCGETIT